MSLLSLSLAAFTLLRLFVRHGKYVQFVVPAVLGAKGWREGQLDPCLGHVPDPCMGTLVTPVHLFCSPHAPGAMTVCWGGGLGVAGAVSPVQGAVAQICQEQNRQLPFSWTLLSQGDACRSVPFQEFSAECQNGSF